MAAWLETLLARHGPPAAKRDQPPGLRLGAYMVALAMILRDRHIANRPLCRFPTRTDHFADSPLREPTTPINPNIRPPGAAWGARRAGTGAFAALPESPAQSFFRR